MEPEISHENVANEITDRPIWRLEELIVRPVAISATPVNRCSLVIIFISLPRLRLSGLLWSHASVCSSPLRSSSIWLVTENLESDS
jgi:hypothetical protein